MKNTAINTLSYTGVVTLSQYIGTKKVKIAQKHNEGRDSLFNFLSDCLIGDFDVARLNRPAKIMLLYAEEEKDTEDNVVKFNYTRVSDFIYLLNKPEKIYSPMQSVVRYSFVVSRDALLGSKFNSIGLYTSATDISNPEDFAAICPFDMNMQTMLAASALVVDWELIISNKGDINTNV